MAIRFRTDSSLREAGWQVRSVSALRRLADRLSAEIGLVLGAIPPEFRTVTGLNRWTGVARPICHRVLAAGRPRPEPLEIIDALPGVDGLEQTLEAIAKLSGERAVKTAALNAVQVYRQMIGELGGSQSKAKRNVRALLTQAPDDPEIKARRALFQAAAEVARTTSDVFTIVQVVSPEPDDGQKLACLMYAGHFGLRLRPGHLQILCSWGNQRAVERSQGADRPEGARPAGLNPVALLGEFSSDPFPRIVTRGEGRFEHDVLDWTSESLESGQSLDIFVSNRAPERKQDGVFEFNAVPRVPCRRLVLDLLLHHSLGLGGAAVGAAYFVGMGGVIRGDPSARWFDRLHDLARSRDDGSHPPAPVHPRHAELVAHALRQAPHPAEEYRSVRWDVEFPVWGADHCVRVYAGPTDVAGR